MRSTASTMLVATAILVLAGVAFAGDTPDATHDYLATFPHVLSREGGGAQTYRLEYHLFNRDVAGATQNRTFVTGTYTRGIEEDRMRWSGVEVAATGGADAAMPHGAPLTIMEGFEYGLSEEILDESLYVRFPNEDLKHLAKTMVWDGMMIEAFDLLKEDFAGLPANEFRRVAEYEDFDIRMGDWGSIKMRDMRVKWSGVSMMHGEPCAVVLYQSLSNPVDAGPTKGRSCYWGQFWLSREDGEIECLTLNKDIVLEIPTGEISSMIMNLQREVRFEKTG